MSTVLRTDRADEDLIEIWLNIAADSPAAADRVVDAIVERWRQLETHPYSGPAREDIGVGIRHLVSSPFLTLYRVEGDDVRILRVLHGRRRIGSQSLVR